MIFVFFWGGEWVRGYTLFLKGVRDPEKVKNLWFKNFLPPTPLSSVVIPSDYDNYYRTCSTPSTETYQYL